MWNFTLIRWQTYNTWLHFQQFGRHYIRKTHNLLACPYLGHELAEDEQPVQPVK